MERKTKLLFVLIFSLSLSSCTKNKSFDREKWKQSGGESIMTNIRLSMTKDLIKSEALIQKNQSFIDSLLGKPKIQKENNKLYLVKEVYSSDIDPDEIIYLSIHFDNVGNSDKIKLIKMK